eukprot:jgi/Galph1/2936/GphlegSOOS_G1620.1
MNSVAFLEHEETCPRCLLQQNFTKLFFITFSYSRRSALLNYQCRFSSFTSNYYKLIGLKLRSNKRKAICCRISTNSSQHSANTENSPTNKKIVKVNNKENPFQEDIERWLRKRRSKGLLGTSAEDDYGRAASFCTAQEYRMGSLFRHFSEIGVHVELYGDIIHATYRDFEPIGDIFVFPYGAVVTWGLDEESESLILKTVRAFERSPLQTPEVDSFRYNHGSQWRISRDCITLTELSGERAVLEKLAASHAMAQSVKLSAFEDSVQNTIAATRHLPEELARYGSISQSRTEISRNLGRLILDRHQVYLHADVLDTPEFFWEYEAFEPLYRSAERYLELRQRAELLNKRVEIVRELFDLLSQELQFKHNSDLEVIIICLITFEIVISLMKDIFPAFINGSLMLGRLEGIPIGVTISVTVILTVLFGFLVIYIWQMFISNMRKRRKLDLLDDSLSTDVLETKDR